MRVKVFIDSNTLFYIYDHADKAKQEHARAWLLKLAETGGGVTNLQVLNEVTNVFLKRMKNWEPQYAFQMVDDFAPFGVMPISEVEVQQARQIRIRYRYSWWDCLLLASALELGCTHFLSEDLQDGQVVTDSSARSLTIVDPFVHSPEQILPS